MNPLYHGKETGFCALGSRFIILQDGPASYHVTVSKEDVSIYEHFSDISSKEHILTLINNLENELFNAFPKGSELDIVV